MSQDRPSPLAFCNPHGSGIQICVPTAVNLPVRLLMTLDDARALQSAIGEAVVEIEIEMIGLEPDPELIALFAPDVRQRAEALAEHFCKPAFIYLPDDGAAARCTPKLPETDLYLRVEPSGSTRLTDER